MARRGATLLLAGLVTAGCELSPATPAERIYVGGDILTMDGDSPRYAEAVAVGDGRILFVGGEEQAMRLRSSDTEVVDLQGRALLPGFVDAHGHFMFSLNMVNQVNVANPPVGPVTDIPSTVAAL